MKLRIQLDYKISKIDTKNPKTSILQEQADLGGGGLFGSPVPQDIDPLPTQRVPLCTILRYSFLVIDPLAPIYTNFEGGGSARRKNQNILVQIFQKLPKNLPFLAYFFKIESAVQKIWSKWGLYSDLGDLRKTLWST